MITRQRSVPGEDDGLGSSLHESAAGPPRTGVHAAAARGDFYGTRVDPSAVDLDSNPYSYVGRLAAGFEVFDPYAVSDRRLHSGNHVRGILGEELDKESIGAGSGRTERGAQQNCENNPPKRRCDSCCHSQCCFLSALLPQRASLKFILGGKQPDLHYAPRDRGSHAFFLRSVEISIAIQRGPKTLVVCDATASSRARDTLRGPNVLRLSCAWLGQSEAAARPQVRTELRETKSPPTRRLLPNGRSCLPSKDPDAWRPRTPVGSRKDTSDNRSAS